MSKRNSRLSENAMKEELKLENPQYPLEQLRAVSVL